MRAVGLDTGKKRIGVAYSDELELSAHPAFVLERTRFKDDLERLVEAFRAEGVNHIVVGLPLNMDGTEGASAAEARRWGEALGHATGLPVDYQDERWSTSEVQRMLISADVSRQKRKEVVDKLAAAVILQGWLDRRATRRENEGDE